MISFHDSMKLNPIYEKTETTTLDEDLIKYSADFFTLNGNSIE